MELAPAVVLGGELQTIVLSSRPAAGATDGAFFQSFKAPHLNGVGKIAFNADLSATTGAEAPWIGQGIWSNALGPMTLVIRRGEPAPGVAGRVFGTSSQTFNDGSLAPILFNDAGDVLFC